MVTPIKSIKTSISTIELMENNVLQISINSNAVVLAEHITELSDACYKIGNGKKFNRLIIFGEYTMVDLDAMKLSSTLDGNKEIAEAYVIKSMAQHILGNFYMHVIKPANPTKFFTDETEAQNWLQSLDEIK
jgi:hypothetical protein